MSLPVMDRAQQRDAAAHRDCAGERMEKGGA
jgi:hypothetical protein